MLAKNIQSSIYEFFTSSERKCFLCDLQTLGLLQNTKRQPKQNTLQQNQKENTIQEIQTYKDLLNVWSNKQTKDLESSQDFLQYCKLIALKDHKHTKEQIAQDTKKPKFKEITALHNEQQNAMQETPKILICSSNEVWLANQTLSFLATKNTIQHNTESSTQAQKNNPNLPIFLPDIRLSPYDSTQSFYEEFHELFAKLALWYENDCKQLLIASPHTLMAFMPSKELLHSFCLKKGQNINLDEFLATLVHYGYESVEVVEMQGEFSRRGDVIDIFIPSLENPVRLSLFDTEIEEIDFFSCETQLSSKEKLDSIKIYPAIFSLTSAQHEILETKIQELDDILEKNINALGFWFLKDIGGINFLQEYSHIFTLQGLKEYADNLEFVQEEILPTIHQKFLILPDSTNYKDLAPLKNSNILNTLKLNLHKTISILSPTNAMLKSYEFDSILQDYKSYITPFYLNIASDKQLFLSLQKPPQNIRKKKVRLELDALKVGEFVVHSEYGIGIFESIKQVSIMGGLKDFISITYANDDKLLLPVENLNLIERYDGHDSIIKIDKLGKSSFLRIKDSIKEKLFAIANEIIRVQAQRELCKGVILTLNQPDQIAAFSRFEEKRGFLLTEDQNLAIQESLKDLQSGVVMDRLLNGDVGFGKTEVAISLCLASALNNYNSIVLVPTTLLCNQHFESFKARLHDFALPNGKTLHITKLDRFTTAKQKTIIEQQIKDGEIQIIIGTHALLNLTIENLGLMVIDEEHKFGVKQKEALKQKSLTTHILSMSATPIPRTLNMAYSKLKSISELKTPPTFKQDGKTFVKIKKDSLIKEIILRELRRGGQVFYIFNNIAKITTIKSYLLALMPQLRILILHSQINPKETEKGMLEFLNKNYDLLLCTSIVESGIHLPNANTIIIDEAHNFGIADLHQLRGRVGRGKHVGFCYLLTREDINEDAMKRLLALEKNSYLGSGASLAYHDLEIRGGGNLLGEAQSGHIKQVGFGMYVRMLEETLHNLLQNGNTDSNKVDINLSVSAFLNENLITSERMRLDLYRRLSQVKTEFEVRQIEGEIEQRFGKLDKYSLQFLELIIIKTFALQLHIKAISNAGYNISLLCHDDKRISLQSPTKDDDDILLTIKNKLKNLYNEQNTKNKSI